MPELPEVNTFKKYFDNTAIGHPIAEVIVHDDHILRNISGELFAERLQGRVFRDTYRQGKYLFADLDNGHSVLLHFGMTGDLAYYPQEEEPPRFERFAFLFANGFRMGFTDPRKFAKIRYLEDRRAYLESIKLGKDALVISFPEFMEQSKNRKTTLKGFLLNQQVLAGVGNLYADEICYRCSIHPASRVFLISEQQWGEIYEEMQNILRFAIAQDATYGQYPDDWLWKWRSPGAEAPDGSGPLEKLTVAGRTTYFSPARQVLLGED